MVDLLLPWLATMVWVAAVPPLFLGWWGDVGGGEGAGGGGRAGLSLRVGVTGLAAAARLSVGRFQIQAYLEGAKESVLKDLRQRRVSFLLGRRNVWGTEISPCGRAAVGGGSWFRVWGQSLATSVPPGNFLPLRFGVGFGELWGVRALCIWLRLRVRCCCRCCCSLLFLWLLSVVLLLTVPLTVPLLLSLLLFLWFDGVVITTWRRDHRCRAVCLFRKERGHVAQNASPETLLPTPCAHPRRCFVTPH